MNLMQLLGVKSKQPLGGRYQLIQPLGQGGFGHTFLATDLHLPDHPTCVIKQLKPHLQDAESLTTARRLFETEARVLYQLGEHSQIPRLLAHFEDDQEFYLAQELIEGESLSTLIQRGIPWSEARVRQLLSEILTPLAFVHERGVIHRDLKPSNLIYRQADGHIVLIDFGAVKQVSERRNNGEATRTISIGTQGYMPNEQLAGNPWFSSDIYAAGMICLQALTGVSPHLLKRDPRTSEVLWQSPDLDITEEFKAVLSRMVCYDYRDRYSTAADVLAELDTLPAIASEPIQLVSPTQPTKIAPPGYSAEAAAFAGQDQIETTPLPSSSPQTLTPQTLAVEKLGLPVLTQSLQSFTKKTVTAITNSPQSRWSILGLSVLAVVALGLMRNGQTSANLAIPTPVVSLAESPPAEGTSSKAAAEEAAASDTESEDTASEDTASEDTASEDTASPDTASPNTASPDTASPDTASEKPESPKPTADSPNEVRAPAVSELLAKASELRDRNQYKDALAIYTQLVERSPEQPEAHWGECYSHNQLQNYGQAVEACDRALTLAPDNVQALWSKGYALEQQGQPQAALALYDQTLALDPNYVEARNNRGGILLRQQRFQEALNEFDRALEHDPNFAEALSNRGAALWGLRRFDEAIASIDKAIELQPDYPEAQALRSQIRQKLGR
ncbi:MAG: tetratricopeptide repeat protein [Cyanobacteria bacterium P01_H01_bin.21]